MNYEFIQYILQIHFLNNSIREYLLSLGLLFVFLIVFKLIQSFVLNKLLALSKKTKTDLDDTLIKIIKDIKPGFYFFLALFLSVKNIRTSELVTSIVHWILVVWVTYIAIVALQKLIDYAFSKKIKKESGNTSEALKTLNTIAQSVLWIFGALFILSNMGISITSVVAGLGIGGIAIALALQNILADLFSSFAIYFDKPFEVGDFIIVGDKLGIVEKIGIKTTRIRALQGEEVVISNQELTSIQIQNFKKLKERRIAFGFGVTYDTPNKKLEEIKKIMNTIFGELPDVRLDRCHFYKFDESALAFEVVYYVNSPEYNVYMDIQEQVNLKLKEALETEGVQMAFPTRTVHIVQ